MADRLPNIAMDTGASIQEHGSAEANIVEAATAFLDNDVNHCVMTPRNMIISRQESARRRSAVQGLVLPSTYIKG